ncbi:GrpB family protein [Streptomyces sp. NPDC055808]
MPEPVHIVEYDPQWPLVFAGLADTVRRGLGSLILRVEHVGSTAVPGLSAKPVIDIDVVIPTRASMPEAVEALRELGYAHEGDMGIPGREAFAAPAGTPVHHLYVCAADSPELARHLAFRDFLRTHADSARRYDELKRDLAARYRHDRAAYSTGKTAFVEGVLAQTRADADRSAGSGRRHPA